MVNRYFVAALLSCIGAAAQPAPQDLLLEAQVEPRQVHVQTQAVYRLRFYQGVDLHDLSIAAPSARLADFRPIGEERVYEALRDGRRYRVHERRYAVFPFASGELEIAGAHVTGRLATPAAKSADGRRTVRIEAPPQVLTVLPIPAAIAVAAESLTLNETWSVPHAAELQFGDVLRRTVRIEASGIEAGQLPELQVAVPGMTVHAEPARMANRFRGELNVALREQSFMLAPLHTGELQLPELQLRWWNSATSTPAVATLPARTLRVAGAATAATPSYWAIAGAGVLGLTAVSVWRRRARLLSALRLWRACRSGRPDLVRDGLLAWVKLRWKEGAPLTLGALAEHLDDGAARSALAELERTLYGGGGGLCEPHALAGAVRRIKREVRRQRRTANDAVTAGGHHWEAR